MSMSAFTADALVTLAVSDSTEPRWIVLGVTVAASVKFACAVGVGVGATVAVADGAGVSVGRGREPDGTNSSSDAPYPGKLTLTLPLALSVVATGPLAAGVELSRRSSVTLVTVPRPCTLTCTVAGNPAPPTVVPGSSWRLAMRTCTLLEPGARPASTSTPPRLELEESSVVPGGQ